MKEKNIQICLNSDCHNADYLDCAFLQSKELIQSVGYKQLVTLTANGFEERDIEEFKFD